MTAQGQRNRKEADGILCPNFSTFGGGSSHSPRILSRFLLNMVVCKRRGCGAQFDTTQPSQGPCTYHPGAPVFHEGLKSWSCCNATNKPVLEFEQFLQLPGCATADAHTDEAQPMPAPKAATNTEKVKSSETEHITKSLDAVQLAKPAAVTPMVTPPTVSYTHLTLPTILRV